MKIKTMTFGLMLSLTFSFILASVLGVSNVSALSINTIYGLRTYTSVDFGTTTTDGIAGGSQIGNVPVEIFGQSRATRLALNKVIINIPGEYGISTAKYNTYTFRIRFYQAPYTTPAGVVRNPAWIGASIQTLSYRVKQSQQSFSVACPLYYSDPATREYSCSFSLSDYETIDYMTFIGGSDTPNVGGIIYQYFDGDPNPVLINFVDINAEGSQDPMVAGQQTIINQNQTIIDQNQQIIDSQNQTNQWLQDSTPPNVDTSSLDTSVGWLPAGPVDSILTLPLQLLQGIVNVFTNTNCAPLQVPVPFVNENITLPCISTLMDEIGFTPIWGIVGGVISAVIIWNTLKWLYKFVDDTLTFRENNSGMWGGL